MARKAESRTMFLKARVLSTNVTSGAMCRGSIILVSIKSASSAEFVLSQCRAAHPRNRSSCSSVCSVLPSLTRSRTAKSSLCTTLFQPEANLSSSSTPSPCSVSSLSERGISSNMRSRYGSIGPAARGAKSTSAPRSSPCACRRRTCVDQFRCANATSPSGTTTPASTTRATSASLMLDQCKQCHHFLGRALRSSATRNCSFPTLQTSAKSLRTCASSPAAHTNGAQWP
mmetsp:Transcript_90365/g.251161  ORF Transcript_90365/g.251161 Transcript_90365/m.251161 type:complete len:229 (-) Transcript_90365:873-1559(-)